MNSFAAVARVFTLFMLLFCSTKIGAATLEKPYSVDVPVPTQSLVDKKTAELEGLQMLLARLTGKSARDNSHIKAQTASGIDKYLLQYSYEGGSTPGSYVLRLTFSEAAINPLLREAGLTLWPLHRPRVLLLMVDTQAKWWPEQPEQLATISAQGRAHGVPLLLLDAKERSSISAEAVQNFNMTALEPALVQYGEVVLLPGVVGGNNQAGWQGKWLLSFHDKKEVIEQKASTLAALFDGLLSEVAQRLSASYRAIHVDDGGAARLRVQVDGITSYAAYKQLDNYVQKLDAVRSVQILEVRGTSVVLRVDVTGRASFLTLMELSKHLIQQQEPLPESEISTDRAPVKPDAVVHFSWIQ